MHQTSLKSEAASAPAPRKTACRPADSTSITEAARILQAGGLVAFPTETVYGLGADATSDAAVAKIYAAKGRPSFNPLIAHVADLAAAKAQAIFTKEAESLATSFWPGPLTLVLPVVEDATVSSLARAGLDSIALRVPAHPVARELLALTGLPLAAPSANLSGHVSSVDAAHVLADLDGRIDLVLDAGRCPVGVESTIVSCLGERPVLLRPGGLSRGALEAALFQRVPDAEDPSHDLASETPCAPGQLVSHYAPRAKLRLEARTLEPGEAGLDFGGTFRGGIVLDLSASRDLIEAAANLFSHLRSLDAQGVATIAVAPIPELGLGEAINDRLRRAAAERPAKA